MIPGSKKLKAAKKEAFAQGIAIEGLGLSASYRKAYDCSNMKSDSVNANARNLAKKDTQVRLRVDYLKEHGLTEQDGPGRPTDFKDAFCAQATHLTKLGATDDELSEFFGCSESTLNLWKQKHPEFSESIKEGKIVTDMNVAVKLNQRATGFDYLEAHPIKLKEVIYKDGKKVSETERIEIVDVKKVIPPDTAAAIFWLTNRRRKSWKQRVNAEHTGEDGAPLPEASSPSDIARAVFDVLREASVGRKAPAKAGSKV